MRRLIQILSLVFVGGLLVTSQALAVGAYQPEETLRVAALTGEELHQWHLAQMHPQDSQVQVQRLTCEQVRTMQALLNQQGYYVSNYECDGIGPETMAAIESFQVDQGLSVTGLPNEETLRALMHGVSQQEYFGIAPPFGTDDDVMTPVFGNDDECIGPVYCDEDD